MLTGHDPLQNYCQREECEVQRPDAQDASNVERPDIQRAHQVLLAQQQFGDQVRAEHKEQADAEGPRGADSRHDSGQEQRHSKLRPERRIVRKRVVEKHHQEGEETQHIQFGMVEARGGGAGTLRDVEFPGRL